VSQVPAAAPPAVGASDLLVVEHVTKAYGREPKRFVAVSDVSLSVGEGQFVCLLGPSGCGKSTLLRIITGLNSATAGRVLYKGAELSGVNPHAAIVFQTFALFPWLSVQENVEVALKARGVEREARQERALQLIDMVGLDGFETAYPRELSGGMRQKVGFARAMAVEPELLCLDEPFSALDVLSAEGLRGELMELWQSHTLPIQAILMVTHNIEEAVFMADRIIVMGKDPGQILTEMAVGLKHPRMRKDTAFQAIVDKVYAAVAGRTPPEAETLKPGMRRLPAARLNALAGFVDTVAAEGGTADLHRLSGELRMGLDVLLPVVEAGELMGLLMVHEGDLSLTPLGQTYAHASILARKELIASRTLRLPMINQIYETLQRDDNQRVDRGYFLDQFQSALGDQAELQLDLAIKWGRYAELFAYDSDSGELYLEA
jgi:NitT/TauT family transport system ATP-binding protein